MSATNTVLIVGNDGAFHAELVNKFYKEGWHISLLTEQQGHIRLPAEIEQYHFGYGSASVKELMESSRPQAVVFTGAYDTRFSWKDDNWEADTGSFIAGLNNVLLSAGAAGVRQFVYLSSDEVFSVSSREDIPETAEPSPKTHRGLCVAQGETMVSSFGRYSQMETVTVRLGSMVPLPRGKEDCLDRVAELCLSALLTGTVTVNSKQIRAPLYAGDAVFALFQIISAPKRGHDLYHLSSGMGVSEADVAKAIKHNFEKPITIVDRTSGPTERHVLSGALAAEEFGFTARMDYERAIAQIVTFMDEHRKNYGVLKKRSLRAKFRHAREWLGGVFPFIECVLYFIPFYLLNSIHTEIALLSRVDFLLLFVFLFALMRGRTMAIVAFCLSIVGYYYQQSQTQGMLQLLISVDTYVWIVQLFVVGISTGYLRDKLIQRRQEGQESEVYLKKRLDEIAAINESNVKIKNYYAEHIVNSDETIGRFSDVITELDNADSGEVLFMAAKLLVRLMGTEHVAIYTLGQREYCRLAAASSSRAMALGKSIHIGDHPALFQPLFGNKIFFNQDIVSGLPSMASSLEGPDGGERLFIFLWDMPFEKKTLQYQNLLKVVGTLIYNATMRSARFLDALAYQRFLPDTHLLTKDAFLQMTDVYRRVSEMGLAQFSILKVKLSDDDTRKKMDARIHAYLRHGDIVGLLKKRTIGILLPNSTPEESKIVKNRLAAAGITAKPFEFSNLQGDAYNSAAVVQGSGIPYKERIFSQLPQDAEWHKQAG